LEYRLGTIHAISDTAEAHAARMLVKRLRYLLESVPRELPGAEAAIGRLKQLQDILGDLHDRLRMALELREAFRDAAIRHARSAYQDLIPWGLLEPAADLPRAPSAAGGLAALALLLRAEGEALFAQLGTVWFEQGAATQLCVDLRALAGIAEGNRPAGIEIERKYLLSGLPPHALTCPSEEIEQGWLPGKELIERLRHVRSGAGDAWFRTVKLGRGLQRIEIEEAATRELFEALWPLTQGCRVRKRRYRVPQGALAWEVDEFLDRDLVLAEIELPTAETRVVPPEWLTGYLVREVTTEVEYVNRTLAR
jgi:CYTH domain-containing protein